MVEDLIYYNSNDIADIQINNARELIFTASSTTKRDLKVKSLLLALKNIEKSLEMLGIHVNNFKVDVEIKKDKNEDDIHQF